MITINSKYPVSAINTNSELLFHWPHFLNCSVPQPPQSQTVSADNVPRQICLQIIANRISF